MISTKTDTARECTQCSFAPESDSPVERYIITHLCEPIVPYIPERIHPNYISLLTFVVNLISAILAILSVHVSNPGKAWALAGAGACLFLAMLGDCLDGMHARNRGRTSKWGEVIDHTLDSIIVPLIPAAMAYALQLPAWVIALAVITATMVYHAQLILYHFTGQFLIPGVYTGTVGQFGCALAYFVIAIVFALIDRTAAWLNICIFLFAACGIISQLHCCLFYYKRLGRLSVNHLPLIVYCSFFGVLFCMDRISAYAFILSVGCVSFRLSGRYVMYTILRKPCPAGDAGLLTGVIILSVVQMLPGASMTGRQSVLYILCVYMITRNVFDILQNRKALR